MSTLDPNAGDGGSCLFTLAIFALVASPVYLLLRVVARSARQMYGFDEPADEPPLVVCQQCHNTVLEPDWNHCPYCGAVLPSSVPAAGSGADRAAGEAAPEDALGDGAAPDDGESTDNVPDETAAGDTRGIDYNRRP